MTATEIGRRAKVHKTKISCAEQAPEARRILRGDVCEGDRRAETLTLTAASRAALDDLSLIADRCDRDLLSRLPVEER